MYTWDKHTSSKNTPITIVTEEMKILGEKWSDSWKKLERGTTALLSQRSYNFARRCSPCVWWVSLLNSNWHLLYMPTTALYIKEWETLEPSALKGISASNSFPQGSGNLEEKESEIWEEPKGMKRTKEQGFLNRHRLLQIWTDRGKTRDSEITGGRVFHNKFSTKRETRSTKGFFWL